MTSIDRWKPPGGPLTGDTPPVTPETGTAAENLLDIIKKLQGEGSKNVQDLGTLAAELAASGELTASQKMLLEASAQFLLTEFSTDAGNPIISGPDQKLIQSFLTSLQKIPVRTAGSSRGELIPAGENAWLNTDAVVNFGVMMMSIINTLGEIRYKEAQKQVELAKAYIAIAKDIADSILAQGDIEAKKRLEMASQYQFEGSMAIVSMTLSLATQLCRSAALSKKELEWKRQPGNENKQLDDATRMQHEREVSGQFEFMSSALRSIPEAMTGFYKAGIEKDLAELEKYGAQARSAEEYMKSLSSLIKDVMGALSSGEQEATQQIKQILDLWISFLQARTQMWSAG